jgi:hypothetical protein
VALDRKRIIVGDTPTFFPKQEIYPKNHLLIRKISHKRHFSYFCHNAFFMAIFHLQFFLKVVKYSQ